MFFCTSLHGFIHLVSSTKQSIFFFFKHRKVGKCAEKHKKKNSGLHLPKLLLPSGTICQRSTNCYDPKKTPPPRAQKQPLTSHLTDDILNKKRRGVHFFGYLDSISQALVDKAEQTEDGAVGLELQPTNRLVYCFMP